MSASVLLNYKTGWGKEIKCEACRAFYLFFATSLINSIRQEHECKILFLISAVKKVIILSCYPTYRFPKICKSLVVYRFYCMALFHSQTRRQRHHVASTLRRRYFDGVCSLGKVIQVSDLWSYGHFVSNLKFMIDGKIFILIFLKIVLFNILN